jgi:hypothetical protein
MILPGSYANGFAPRDDRPLYPELWRGCVGAWAPCLGPSGLTLRDWSGRRNNGTLTSMEPSTDWVPSGGKYALDFATDDYVVCGSPGVSSNIWTVAIWALYRSTATSQCFWSQYTSGDAGRSFLVINYDYISGGVSANQLAFGLSGSGVPELGTGTGTLAVNTWYHIAVRASGSEISLWVNGIQTATKAYTNSIQQTPITFGRLGNLSAFYLNGQIDDARGYNRSLSGNEIRTLASRRGIAYEMAPRRRSVTVGATFNRRRRLLLGSI